ncbi:MAG: hypothetical protein IJ191_06790 [Treponema sp.]|nr:hypothetical protein [Treponema sp.]
MIRQLVLISIIVCGTAFYSSAQSFSHSFGFSVAEEMVTLKQSPYTPQYANTFSGHFYCAFDVAMRNYFLSVKPGFIVRNDSVRFELYEFKNTVLFNRVAMSFGKYNLYWGTASFQNDYFLNIPVTDPKNKQLWNIKINALFSNALLEAGVVIDTDSLDAFTAPTWLSCFGAVNVSFPAWTCGIVADYFFHLHETDELKCAAECTVNAFTNITLYIDGALKTKVQRQFFSNLYYSATAGMSWYFANNSVPCTFIGELGAYDNDFCYCVALIPTVYDYFECFVELKHNVSSSILLMTGQITVDINTFNLYVKYHSPNLLKQERQNQIITIGVKYEF